MGTSDDLRALADFYDERPNFPVPSWLGEASVYAWSRDEFARLVREMGGGEKTSNDWSVGVRRKFGNIGLVVRSPHEAVCEKKVIGHRTVPASPEHVEEIVEWTCPDSLLRPPSGGV